MGRKISGFDLSGFAPTEHRINQRDHRSAGKNPGSNRSA
jgi:hypothetical protein